MHGSGPVVIHKVVLFTEEHVHLLETIDPYLVNQAQLLMGTLLP